MDHYYCVNNLHISENSIIQQKPQLLSFARKSITLGIKNPVHFHAHLEIFYYLDGHGFFEINSKKTPIKRGDLVVVNPYNKHIQYPQKDSVLSFFVMSVDSLSLYGLPVNSLSVEKANLIHFDDDNNHVLSAFYEMQDELENKQYDYFSKTTALLYQILIDIRRLLPDTKFVPANKQLSTPAIITKIKDYIDTHFMDDLTLDDLVKRSYMNRSYFLKQFKHYFQVSPMKYMMSVRLQYAQLLLIKTELSISEIALSLQFSSFAYFSEMFKKYFDVTPTEFRIRNR